MVGSESFQGEPERRDPDRLVWSVDASLKARAQVSLLRRSMANPTIVATIPTSSRTQ
jgi:hypothetical protein